MHGVKLGEPIVTVKRQADIRLGAISMPYGHIPTRVPTTLDLKRCWMNNSYLFCALNLQAVDFEEAVKGKPSNFVNDVRQTAGRDRSLAA